MPWNGTITTENGKEFCITTGAGPIYKDSSLRIALNKNDLEGLTDQELIKVLRNFQNKANEIELIGLADEYGWDIQCLTPADLLTIANSEVASDKEKEMAKELLKNPLARFVPYIPPKRKKKAGYIYLFRDVNYDWHFKIGMSSNPKRRLRQVGYSVLVYCFPADDMVEAEFQLHQLYDKQRTNGEWFRLFESNIEYIKSIKEYKSGNFVIMEGQP